MGVSSFFVNFGRSNKDETCMEDHIRKGYGRIEPQKLFPRLV